MVYSVTQKTPRKPRRERLDKRRVRAGLIMLGQSLTSVAEQHGVSRMLVSKILNDRLPARSGRSATIRRQLEEIAA